MKAKKLLALLLALAMLVSCFASINAVAFDGEEGVNYIRFNFTELELSDGARNEENKVGWLGGDAAGKATIYFNAGVTDTYNFQISVTDYTANGSARALDAKVGDADAVCVVTKGTATADDHVMDFTLALTAGQNKIVFGNLVASDGENDNALGIEFIDIEVKSDSDGKSVNTAPVNAVEDQINALPAAGDITVDDKATVKAARDAYNALTDAQKALVSADALATLANAEVAVKAAEDAAFLAKYNKIEAENCETTSNKTAADAASGGYDIGGNVPLSFYYEVAETGTYELAMVSACFDPRAYQINVYSYATGETYGPVDVAGVDTDTWHEDFTSETAQVTLTAGVNKVTLTQNNGTGYLPNFDYFGVEKKDGDVGYVAAPADPTKYVTIEAESGACVGVEPMDNEAASGGQQIGGFNYNGGNTYVTYNYYVAEAGEYKLKVAAANGDGTKRRNNIFAVNGVEAATVVVGDTGGWSNAGDNNFVEQDAVTITLAKGLNVIKMYTNEASGYSSLACTDYIKIETKNDNDVVLPSGTVDYVDAAYIVTNENGPLPEGVSPMDENHTWADPQTNDIAIPVWMYGEDAPAWTYDREMANNIVSESMNCGGEFTYADDNGYVYSHGFTVWPQVARRINNWNTKTSAGLTGNAYDVVTIPVPKGATAFYTNYGREAHKNGLTDMVSKAEFYIGGSLVATAEDVKDTHQQVLINIPEGTTEIQIRVYVGCSDNKHMMFADAMFIGAELEAPLDIDILTTDFVNTNGTLTLNAKIDVAKDEIEAINEKAVFEDYGVYYGVSKDAVLAAVAAGEGDDENSTNKTCIKKSFAGEKVEGEVEVYTVFGMRVPSYTGGERAAMFYVEYTVGGVKYVALSDCEVIVE